MDNEKNIQQSEAKQRDKKKLIGILLLLVIAALALLLFSCTKKAEKTAWLGKQLENESEKVVELDEDIVITEPLMIYGTKTISGEGRIVYRPSSSEKLRLTSYMIPDGACEAVEIADLSEIEAMFVVADGASLTIGGSVTLDGNGKALDVKVEENGTLNVIETAVLENGKGANIYSDGEIVVSGGQIIAQDGYNIMTNGSMSVTGGEISGSAKQLMGIVSNGTLDISGGTITKALGTNVYVTGGTVTVSGGTISGAGLDNVYVETGKIDVTGGKVESGKHGLHNAGEIELTDGELVNNINNFYNEGIATVTDYSFGNSQGHNVVNTGSDADMVMTGSVITNATTHALYNVLGAKLELEDFTVQNALSKGIHNGGGFLNGKDITIVRAGGAGVGNEKEKGCAVEGVVNIENLKVLKAKNFNLLNSGGEMTVTNAKLGVITTHAVQVSDGTLNLKDVEIEGTAGTSTAHGFYLMGGVINAENVTLAKSASRGIQNRGGEFYGKNITITDVNGTGIGQMTGVDAISESTTVIDGLVMKDITGYSLQNTNKGTMKISNAKIEISNNTAVRNDDGSMTINNATFTGVKTEKEPDSQYGGFSVRGGVVTLNDVTVTNVLGRGISNEGATVKGKNLVFNGVEGTGICTEKGGTTNIDTVSLTNVKGYDVDVKQGSATFTNGTFNISKTTSCTHIKEGTLTINDSVMNGAPEIVKADGTIGKYHGVTVDGGTAILNNVTIKDTAGNGIRNSAGTVKGKNIVLENCAKSLATRLYNAAGHEMYIDGLEITGKPQEAYNIENRGTMTLKNATICKAGTSSLNLPVASETNLKNVVFEGTTKGNTIFIKSKDVVLNMDTVTINDTGSVTAARAISNGGSSAGKSYPGGTINAKNLVINGGKATVITNESGNITIDGLVIEREPVGAYNIENRDTMTIKNATICKAGTSSLNLPVASETNLKNVVFEGTTKGNTIFVKSKDAVLNMDSVTINDTGSVTAARAISNGGSSEGKSYPGGTINAKKLVINGGGVASAIVNESGTVNIDGLVIEREPVAAYNVDNRDKMTIKNATLCKSGTSSLNIQGKSETNLENVTFEGTTSGHTVYIKSADAVVNMDTITFNSSGARALSNGNNSNGTAGGTVTAKNLTVNGTTGTGIANDSGTMTIDGLTMTGHTGYGVDNRGTATVKNVVMPNNTKAGAINNTSGTMTVENVDLNCGTSTHPGIRIMDGTVTMGGTLKIATTGSNAIYLDTDATVERAIFQEGAILLTAKAINLPTGHYVSAEGMLGNTGEQTIMLKPEETTAGTVYVDTPDAQTAQNLAVLNVFKPKGVSAVAGEGDNADKLVAGMVEFDEEVQTKEVSTWAELKTAIENVEDGDNLNIVLLNNIDETEEGVITVGLNAVTKVNLTDNGNGYTITRTDLTKALFSIYSVSSMTINQTIIVDGASNKTTTANEAIFLNEGTLTIGSGVTVKNGYKSGSNNSLSGTGKSAGAIESTGTLNINGTVTASGSGNGTAVVILAGTLKTDGAKLNNNIGRALRVGGGTADITNSTELNYNSGANGGGALLIDAATVTVKNSKLNNNTSTGTGGAVQITAASNLTIEESEIKSNQSAGNGGGIQLAGGAKASVTLKKCEVSGNTANGKNSNNTGTGGGIYANYKGTLKIEECTISGNKAVIYGTNATTGNGGGIYIYKDSTTTVTMEKSYIKGNSATIGGGIYVDGTGKVTITNCHIGDMNATDSVDEANRSAKNGGGMFITNNGNIEMSNCKINRNVAGNGGAISYWGAGSLKLTSCEMNGNEVTNGGGSMYIENTNAKVTLNSCEMKDNEVDGRGGAIRIDKGKVTIDNGIISNNYAKTSGGAFFINTDGTVEMSGCTISGSSSGGNGQTIHVKGTLSLKACTINGASSVNADTTQIYKEGSPTVSNEE